MKTRQGNVVILLACTQYSYQRTIVQRASSSPVRDPPELLDSISRSNPPSSILPYLLIDYRLAIGIQPSFHLISVSAGRFRMVCSTASISRGEV